MTAPLQITPRVALQLTPQMRALLSSMSSVTPAQTSAYVASERAAAAAMSDDDFWNWDRAYGTDVGLAAPTLVDCMQQGMCGGGGCSPSYANSQFWRANVACSADVYGRVLFQYRRYVAAQIRLQSLLNNPPQAWPGRMYFADSQNADGSSKTLPQRPASEQPLSTKAAEWATWCVDVMRLVSVAHWATGVRWCEADRNPSFYGGNGQGGGYYVKVTGGAPADAFSDDPATTTMALLPINLRGTIGGIFATAAHLIASSGNASALAAGYVDDPNNYYWPDAVTADWGSFHPLGYFRPMGARGSAPARWTWGSRIDANQSPFRGMGGDFLRDPSTGYSKMPKACLGVCEHGWSSLPEAQVFEQILWSVENGWATRPNWIATFLMPSECLATRHGGNSGPHTFLMPESKADFDPVLTPALVHGSTIEWPEDLQNPTDGSPTGVLTALFSQLTQQASGPVTAENLTSLRVNWQLHLCQGQGRYLPTGLRQIWWCMAQAYDVIDSSFGTVIHDGFANMAQALLMIPPGIRGLNPTEAFAFSQSAAQDQLNGVMAFTSHVSSGVGSVPIVGSLATTVCQFLMTAVGAIAQSALSSGAARMSDPPIMPTPMCRVAGVDNDPTDPCWLNPASGPGGGGAAALLNKTDPLVAATASSDNPSDWYAQVQAAIAQSGGGGPPTAARVNKGVALGAGAIAGLALVKLLGLGAG